MNWLDALAQGWNELAQWFEPLTPFIEDVHVWSMLVVLWVGTPIQVLFVVLYATRNWTKYSFSRALMWKSGSLALYLYAGWCKVAVAGLRGYDWPLWIDLQTPLINAVVFWAIVNQLRALLAEIAAGDMDATQTEVNDKAHEEQLDN